MPNNPFASLFGGLQVKNTPKSNFLQSYGKDNSMLGFSATNAPNMSTPTGPKYAPPPVPSSPGATPPMSTNPAPATKPPSAADAVNKKLGLGSYYPGGPAALSSAVKNDPKTQYMSGVMSSPNPQPFALADLSGNMNPNAGKFGTGGIDAPAENDPQATYKTAFESYLKSLMPSDDEERASKSLREFDVQSLKDQEKALESGETLGFARGEAERTNRNNAIERMARASSLEALTGKRTATNDAMKARLDFEKSLMPKNEAFTLGENEVRYDAKGNVIARGSGASTGTGGAYTPGENPTVDAYVTAVQKGTLKLENVPTNLRGAVAQGLASAPEGADPKKQYVKSQADEALTNIDKALAGLKGPIDESPIGPAVRAVAGMIPGSGTSDINAAMDTVKALVGFDALQKMRESSPTGGALGQITERELAFLQSVQGSLSNWQSTGQLVDTLSRIRKSFQTLQLVNSPDGTKFELDGTTYIKDGDQLVPEGFKGVGGDTKKASKVVGGYDIGSYATDPNHERRVASIFNAIQAVSTSTQADAYIQGVAPGSPVRGADVAAAAQQFGVSIPMMLAIMQQDSTFGTRGKAVRTLNPGNVGNTDSGATRTYKTWRDGVFAVAQNLSKRKVA